MLLPNFNTWYAAQRLKPGTRVRIVAKDSIWYGEECTISSYRAPDHFRVVGLKYNPTKEHFGNAHCFEVIDAAP